MNSPRETSPLRPLQSLLRCRLCCRLAIARHSLSRHRITVTEPVSASSSSRYYLQDLHRTFLHTHLRACFARTSAPAYFALRQGHRAFLPSIFGCRALGGCVVTRSSAAAYLHGHRPAVFMRAHPSLCSGRLAPRWVRSLLLRALTARSPLVCRDPDVLLPLLRTFVVRQILPSPYRTFRSHTAVLRDISAGTSYQTARLVFRHCAHVLPTSCTSVRLRPSIHLSLDFSLRTRSSLSFGSRARNSCVSAGSHLAAHADSLVRVSIRARVPRLPSCPFAVRPPYAVFSTSARATVRYRSLGVFCLRCFRQRSHCATRQHYSFRPLRPGLSPALALLSIRSRTSLRNASRPTT